MDHLYFKSPTTTCQVKNTSSQGIGTFHSVVPVFVQRVAWRILKTSDGKGFPDFFVPESQLASDDA